jgi:hypothetical protein
MVPPVPLILTPFRLWEGEKEERRRNGTGEEPEVGEQL